MPAEYPIELIDTDRPNRFQVNPVTQNMATSDEADNELFDEDPFNTDDIILRNNRRSSRYVLQSNASI